MIWTLIVFVALGFLVFFVNRGGAQATSEYEARRDSTKADVMMAEVRRELAEKSKQPPSSD